MPGPRDDSARDRASSVAAVVSAFEPDENLLRACRAVAPQVGALVVVDDGSRTGVDAVLDACRALGAHVVRHPENRGIGAALNTGVTTARELLGERLTGILTLDQDSAVPDGYVDALLDAERGATAAGVRVGMVGPEQAQGIRSSAGRTREGVVHSREPIQSGLLVPLAVLDELGPFADELVIDGVDTELYLRATTRGYAALVARGARLDHRLGRAHVVSFAGRRLALTHAAEFRYYYIARNRVALLRRYARSAPGWAVGAVAKDVRHLAVTTLLVPGRRGRLAQTAAGLRDGARGVLGRRSDTP
jgi:rhamnosyltransferase